MITQELWDCSTLSRTSLHADQLYKHVLNYSLYVPQTKNVSPTVLHTTRVSNISHNLRASQHSINTMRNVEFVLYTMGTIFSVYIHTTPLILNGIVDLVGSVTVQNHYSITPRCYNLRQIEVHAHIGCLSIIFQFLTHTGKSRQ